MHVTRHTSHVTCSRIMLRPQIRRCAGNERVQQRHLCGLEPCHHSLHASYVLVEAERVPSLSNVRHGALDGGERVGGGGVGGVVVGGEGTEFMAWE